MAAARYTRFRLHLDNSGLPTAVQAYRLTQPSRAAAGPADVAAGLPAVSPGSPPRRGLSAGACLRGRGRLYRHKPLIDAQSGATAISGGHSDICQELTMRRTMIAIAIAAACALPSIGQAKPSAGLRGATSSRSTRIRRTKA